MHYSFRNTLCGLAVVIAAGLLAEQSVAQTVTLEADESDMVSLAPVEDVSAMPEEISLFDEQMGDVSLPTDGLLAPAQPTDSTATDIIPMEGSAVEEDAPQADVSPNLVEAPVAADDEMDINLTIEGDPNVEQATPPQPVQNAPETAGNKTVSTTPPAGAAPTVTGKLLGAPATGGFDENISPSISNDLFMRMSDLEKQTTLLNLELKKERVQNEIAAVKAQRLKAQQEEEARREEEERKRIEWENEQQRLMVAEQTKLREAEAKLESLRQEKIVKAYKATMLDNIQKWIDVNGEVYKQVALKNAEIKKLMEDNQNKLKILQQRAEDVKSKAENARIAHDKKIANLESQISILKTRLEAEIEASKKKDAEAKAAASARSRRNPFATASTSTVVGAAVTPTRMKLSDEYAIMEITGKGSELAAKLINTDGDVFMAKVGTTLLNGFTIDDIAQTYISAVNKNNERDFLYFSAGGILDQEPIPSDITIKAPVDPKNPTAGGEASSNRGSGRRRINATQGIPSLGQGMFIR